MRTPTITINYQFGAVAHGASIRVQAKALKAEHQAIIRDVLAVVDFWGCARSASYRQFITELRRDFRELYIQANAHGSHAQTAGANIADTGFRYPRARSTSPGVRR